uniref:Solute:Na+ symporter, SSS family n=1 Tax=Candidatus Kentrum sp. FM TaxID=2126340 RepID=A0A450TLU1_9GAMM|nr:MAG: solute:Na+ symporter, SSS family [Candidatus Kentron sp. FM]VFJ68739.1 MAG: solute:Na+ symporter, SSS family [Candidatus Kentron sp. FM]VFK17098.1 MAG: solute:Na+ symporter, SSS family [Candidatus Kentron sp. FM]
MTEFRLETLDLVMVAIYVVFIVWLGLWFSRRMRTSDDYFLAGRSLTWWLIGFSLLASNMSSSSLIGMAGEAYADGRGIAVYNYEWMAAVVLVVFVVFFFPLYLRARVFTMPEFLERRFDGRSRYYFSAITIAGNILIDTAAALYAGSLVIQIIYPGVPIWICMLVLAVLAGLYTMAGGLKAVVYTDAIQAVLLLAGAMIISFLAFGEAGSWQAVTEVTPPEMLSLIRPADDPILPWPGLITGVFLLGFYFWGNNQFMVQRVLGAKDLDHGRHGALFAGFLKLPLIFIMVLPGTFARVIYGPTGLERPDMAFPMMMFDLLPVGLRGIILTALIAAIMSSIDSTLNSASTLVTMDFVKKLRPMASERTLVWTGRLTTGIFMVLAALWAPVIVRFDTLWHYLQSVLAYISPPIVACFLMGVFWKRANRHGAFSALVIGHLAALGIFILKDYLGVVELHFLYIPPILVTLCILVIIAVSLASEEPDIKQIGPYRWTPRLYRDETVTLAGLAWYRNYRVLSGILLAATAVFVGMFW